MNNMILAVGPGTPAHTCFDQRTDQDEADGYPIFPSDSSYSDDDDDDDQSGTAPEYIEEASLASELSDGDEGSVGDVPSPGRGGSEMARPSLLQPESERNGHVRSARRIDPGIAKSEIRHTGCINTACWIECPWRMSVAGAGRTPNSIGQTRESPTQIATAGDDVILKVWDVSQAMGAASTLPMTHFDCPFGDFDSNESLPDLESYYAGIQSPMTLPGSVIPVGAYSSGHHGNIFHVCTVWDKPGNFLTCSQDGLLRLLDMEAETSSIVMKAEVSNHFVFRPSLAFLHVMVSSHTGLLCSEAGLHHFDLRMRQELQNQKSLLDSGEFGTTRRLCKTCAVWRPGGQYLDMAPQESNYVFAGMAGATVTLLDLRMDGSSGRVVEKFQPAGVNPSGRETIAVSGLDISRDSRELLVSYEGDAVYTFPILASGGKERLVEISDIDTSAEKFSHPDAMQTPELVTYGCHLNCKTFLKNAKFAGPFDDYICTGSDSGHAWIYERKSGTVVSLLKADTMTCNGVLPHSTLPYLLTYGIDHTAKLWKASPPVDHRVDDSSSGRCQRSRSDPMSIRTFPTDWGSLQFFRTKFAAPSIALYDWLPTSDFVERSNEAFNSSRHAYKMRAIRNDLMNLPEVAARATLKVFKTQGSLNEGVQHCIDSFVLRLSIIRLRHQADRLGVSWKLSVPYHFFSKNLHPAESVPDHPLDWLLYDPKMNTNPCDPQNAFNSSEISREIMMSRYPEYSERNECDDYVPWLEPESQIVALGDEPAWTIPGEESWSEFVRRSRKLLLETISMLKSAGNSAMAEKEWHVAGKRYDKALQYCSVTLTQYPGVFAHFQGHVFDEGVDEEIVVWTPVVEIFITLLLNQSLLFQKHLNALNLAAHYADIALEVLLPFCATKGKRVFSWDTFEEKVATFNVCRALQAKAYFRLGSAKLLGKQYREAVLALKASIKATDGEPERLVLQRLSKAKQKWNQRKKRNRSKFEDTYWPEED